MIVVVLYTPSVHLGMRKPLLIEFSTTVRTMTLWKYSELFKGVQKNIVDDNHEYIDTVLSEPLQAGGYNDAPYDYGIYQVFLVTCTMIFKYKVSLILMK
jgi:hypothetical protein